MNLKLAVSTSLQTMEGDFVIDVFTNESNEEYIVLRTPNISNNSLIRVHSQCFTGDCFHSLYCDCYEQLQDAKIKINESKNGMIIYLNQEGRGIGLINKLKAYELQRQGLDTYDANIALGFKNDYRNYDMCIHILKFYNLDKILLLTNNVDKIQVFKNDFNVKRVAQIIKPNQNNQKYLQTKKSKMGQLL